MPIRAWLPQSRTTFAVIAVTCLAFLAGLWTTPVPVPDDTRSMVDGPSQKQINLTRHDGKAMPWGETSGRPRIVYFGYTFCPDICPMGLSNVAEVVDLAASQGIIIDPIFVSFDPKRDTPEILSEYVQLFHDRLIGFSGEDDQVRELANAFSAFFEINTASAEDEYYLMNHTSFIYIVDGDGRLLGYFPDSELPTKIYKFVVSSLVTF